MNTILSVIIPVYKVESYIGKTLRSLMGQKSVFENVELIFVNDGTPDNSMELVKDYLDKIPNIKIINQENGGLSNARNTGLKQAVGEYVWFVDSDDWLEDDCIRYILDRLAANNGKIDVYCYRIREYSEDGSVICERNLLFKDAKTLTGREFLNTSIGFTPMQQFIIKKSFLEINGLSFKDGLVHEDIEFAPKMLLCTKAMQVVPETTYCYLRRSGGNITGSKKISENRLISLLYILEEYRNLEKMCENRDNTCIFQRIQKIAVQAIYGFSSIEQVKQNYLNAFSSEQIKLYRRIILRNIISFNYIKFYHVLFDIVFVISPMLFKRISIILQK